MFYRIELTKQVLRRYINAFTTFYLFHPCLIINYHIYPVGYSSTSKRITDMFEYASWWNTVELLLYGASDVNTDRLSIRKKFLPGASRPKIAVCRVPLITRAICTLQDRSLATAWHLSQDRRRIWKKEKIVTIREKKHKNVPMILGRKLNFSSISKIGCLCLHSVHRQVLPRKELRKIDYLWRPMYNFNFVGNGTVPGRLQWFSQLDEIHQQKDAK